MNDPLLRRPYKVTTHGWLFRYHKVWHEDTLICTLTGGVWADARALQGLLNGAYTMGVSAQCVFDSLNPLPKP